MNDAGDGGAGPPPVPGASWPPRFDPADPGLRQAGTEAFGTGFSVRAVARTASTQDLARAAARAGAPAGWSVVAEEQTAGRGRQGRRWEAPPGAALLASVVVGAGPRRGGAPPGWLPLAAGLAVADALADVAGVEALLKWPNDVLATAGGKLAGLLVEVEPRARGGVVVVGVGVNVTVDEFPEGARGASLHRVVGRRPPPRREALLGAVLLRLSQRLRSLDGAGPGGLRRDYLRRSALYGADVRVVQAAGEVVGRAIGVDDEGALLVRVADGVRRLVAGEVHLVDGPATGSP